MFFLKLLKAGFIAVCGSFHLFSDLPIFNCLQHVKTEEEGLEISSLILSHW